MEGEEKKDTPTAEEPPKKDEEMTNEEPAK